MFIKTLECIGPGCANSTYLGLGFEWRSKAQVNLWNVEDLLILNLTEMPHYLIRLP